MLTLDSNSWGSKYQHFKTLRVKYLTLGLMKALLTHASIATRSDIPAGQMTHAVTSMEPLRGLYKPARQGWKFIPSHQPPCGHSASTGDEVFDCIGQM
jgi:hypothetical protein